ncbi:MAG: anti-sigma factor [Elainellaceae cyanobacterium]
MTHQYPSTPLSDEEQALAAGYVLGDLSDDEQHQLEALLQERPELQREVNALSVSLRSLPHGLPTIAPPPDLEAKILAAYDATLESTAATETLTSSTDLPSPSPSLNPRRSIPWSKIIAAITTLIALLLGANNAQLRFQLASTLDQEGESQRVAEILQRPNSRLVALEGLDETNTATAGGTLLFTAGQWQEVVVSLSNLPPLPVDQVYRMWLTLENGDVLFCGEFNTNSAGQVSVRLTPPETPPEGVKTTGLFVTQDASSAPLEPGGLPVMIGEI